MTAHDDTLIFQRSRNGRSAAAQAPRPQTRAAGIPDALRRRSAPGLPAVSELQVVRHYTRLSQKNFSIDTQFYPLGSCTMKYNPRACNSLAMLPGFVDRHPLAPAEHSQGFLQTMFELQEMLREVTGMSGVSLTPMAGAQGEFAGVAMIRAYHRSRGDDQRREIIVPDAAHGTNPATAIMCGYQVREIPTDASGDVDLEALKAVVGPQTAGIMLTNPSTVGVFERHIREIAGIVHDAGGLLYYDGANLNAILGKVRPGDMGFDVIHMNLHKTFSTPHGGGGPRMLGREGMTRVAEFSTLNANYLLAELRRTGFDLAFPERRATHEFIVTLKRQAKETGLTAMDVAKRLLDHGYHAPTTYFPLLVPECLLIEPTETESQETLDGFVAAMAAILEESRTDMDTIKSAPHRLPNRRFNEVAAAKRLDVVFRPETETRTVDGHEAGAARTGTHG
ncbi:MAG: aminomethyl-transferring glycine dehydrogenase subunit GcvPB [Thioalkalivibrio sp.]|nr:aminomethyl-transferring glycine dehydrogenase subunit GcvPB [Thioalkalivibrio sp.]